MSILKISMMALLLSGFSSYSMAQDEIPKGVIVSKSEAKQAVTVRNSDTGKRHTYFFNQKTKVMSDGKPLSFDQIKPGQAVALYFTRTDLGRELTFIRIPDLDQRVELEPIESEQDYFVSGVVTGVRPVKRTITIHGPRLTQRMTLHVPDSVRLTRGNDRIKLKSIKQGDMLELRYNETDQGFVIVSGEMTRKETLKIPQQ